MSKKPKVDPWLTNTAKADFLPELKGRMNGHFERTKSPTKFLVADFVGMAQIKHTLRDYERDIDFTKPFYFQGAQVIKAEDCEFIIGSRQAIPSGEIYTGEFLCDKCLQRPTAIWREGDKLLHHCSCNPEVNSDKSELTTKEDIEEMVGGKLPKDLEEQLDEILEDSEKKPDDWDDDSQASNEEMLKECNEKGDDPHPWP